MNDLFNYQSALRDTIADHQQDLAQQAEKNSEFNTKIQEALTPFTAEFLREGIPSLTQKIGSVLGDKLGLSSVARIAKNFQEGGVPKAISGEVQERLKRSGSKQETPENPGETPDITPSEPIPSQEFQNPVFDPESAPALEEGTNLYKMGDILNDAEMFKTYAKNNFADLAEQGGEQGIEEARQQLLQDPTIDGEALQFLTKEPIPTPGATSNNIGRLLRQGSPTQPTPETPEPTISEEPSPTIPTSEGELAEAGENLAKTTAKTAIKDIGENIGEDLGETALDADPFTAPIGIILGIGSLLGEIFGQKHPVEPSPTPTQPSTQFGI